MVRDDGHRTGGFGGNVQREISRAACLLLVADVADDFFHERAAALGVGV